MASLLAGIKQQFNRTAAIDSSGRISITPKQIYIIPTKFGLVFATMIIAMFIGSNNYEINLGFALTFLLVGIGFASMLQSWRNLAKLEITEGRLDPVFCGESAIFPLLLHNNSSMNRSGLHFHIDNQSSVIDVPANTIKVVNCPVKAKNRGLMMPDRWTVYSYFPTGMFYCWAYFKTHQKCLVYPAPSDPDMTIAQLFKPGKIESFDASISDDNDDFYGHRQYTVGDNVKRLDWKALARGRGKLIKQFQNAMENDIWLRWDDVLAENTEQKLSILCRAVLELTEAKIIFGLALPDATIAPDAGWKHKSDCLEALALFGQ